MSIFDRKYPKEDSDIEYLDGIEIVRLNSRKFNAKIMVGNGGKFSYLFKMVLNQSFFSLHVKTYLSGEKSVRTNFGSSTNQ